MSKSSDDDSECFFSMLVENFYGDTIFRDALNESYYDMTFDEFRESITHKWSVIKTVEYTYNGKYIVVQDHELKGEMTLRQFYNKEKEMNEEKKIQ